MRWLFSLILAAAQIPPVVGAADGGVEVLRDPWGVPHVFAAAAADGFFGWGYACAEDRRLQMELVRRRGTGRLAEVFGPEWVRSDREARLAGYAESAPAALERLPSEMQDWLRAYAAGVNAWTVAHPDVVARRFRPLGVAPEPWTPADCLVTARAALALGSPFSDQPAAAYHRFRDLAAQVGEEEAGQRLRMAVEDAAAIVSEAEMARDTAAYERLQSRPRMPGFRRLSASAEGPKMSHAWAVSGARSRTGRPLLESDPQLPLCSPPFFHEVHLAAGGIDARGLGVPGCPGLFIGFNRRLAWGASALGVGSQAVFLEKLTEDGGGYRFAGQTVAFARRLERIAVKGGVDVVQEVLTTRHGVVFDSLAPPVRAGEAQVLHDAQTLGRGTTVRALLAWLTADNWAEFRTAMEHYYDPGVHLVYADVDGNLGYQTLVHRPLTSRSPRLAQEGWTGEQEVLGRIPLDELPHMLNPESGVISHANNMPVGTWYPYDLGIGTGGNGHTGRSWRLQRLLSGTRTFALEHFEAEIHRDAVNQVVAALLPVARRVAEEDGTADPAVTRLLAAVAGWDLRADSVDRCPAAAALQNAMTPYRGSGLNDAYGAGMGGVTNLARRLAADFERDGATPRGERERAYLHRWLQAATQGDRPRQASGDDWTARLAAGTAPPAGRTITIPYQRMAPLNLPTVDPALDIVSPPLACLDTGTLWSQPSNVYTQIVDLAEVDNSRAMIAPGNSEDGTDPQRTAGIDLWVQGRTRPAPLSRVRVEQLGGTRTAVAVRAYSGAAAAPLLTVEKPEPGWQFVAAMPPPAAATAPQPRPRPADAQRPDDPRIEAHFRVILRQGTAAAEVDAQLAAGREYVGTDAGRVKQLRGATVLGIYLIEESAAGRLRVQYGSQHALDRLRGLLREIDAMARTAPAAPGQTATAVPAAVPADSPPPGAEAAPGPVADPTDKAPTATPRATRRPEIWLCTGNVGELLRQDADWSFVKQNLDGIKLYVGLLHQPPPGQLEQLVAMVRDLGLQVAVELGCCLDFGPMDETNGEWSARSETTALDRWYAAGGTVDYLDLDGPVRRLLHPENRSDGKRVDSLEAAVRQVVKAVGTFHAAHPEMEYWHLTNFPNWGYRGDVSYHARGPNRQDYGEYDDAHRLVLEQLRTAGLPLEGVTIDNPYDYLVGEHFSVNLKPATTVDWIRRVRDYEDRSRAEGLTVNLIVNSERGGQQSDALFSEETLKMVDAYRRAGGRPDRWIVQSWYPHPKAIVPETDPTTMTGLVKAVIERVHGP